MPPPARRNTLNFNQKKIIILDPFKYSNDGALVDVMSGTSYIVMRSIISKIVPHAELGQVSAIIAVIETIVPVIYKPLYSAIYRATLNTFPGTFYVIGSIMLIPAIFIYWWMYRLNNQEDEKKSTVEEIGSNNVHDLEKY
uniref:Solute carrier family 46 member 3 n=1 Tax=Melanaphis sacchari TaxID=742174 RepID=A0A2H8TKS9_9HEMI